jgi:hypothetical protein
MSFGWALVGEILIFLFRYDFFLSFTDESICFIHVWELLQFRNDKFDPFPILEKCIENATIRDMISQMIVRDPLQRKESLVPWYGWE